MLSDGEKGVVVQRDRETYAVAPNIPCGMVTPEQLRKLADVAEKYGAQAMKITSASRIALLGVRGEDIDNIWSDLDMEHGNVVGICVRSVKACPGTTFCKRGKQDSLTLGLELDKKYHGSELPSKTKIGVSGCLNQCAETFVKEIGLVGTGKGWRVYVGGAGGTRPRLADLLIEDLSTEDALEMIDRVLDFYRATAKPGERLGRMIDRIGLDPLREATCNTK